MLNNWIKKNIKKKKQEITKNLPLISQSSINILKMIQSSATGMSLDEISLKANVNVSEVSTILLDLELNGLIKAMPGQIYIRNI